MNSTLQLKNPYEIYKMCKVLSKEFYILKSNFKLTRPDKQDPDTGLSKCLYGCVMLALCEHSPEEFWLKEDERNQDFAPQKAYSNSHGCREKK